MRGSLTLNHPLPGSGVIQGMLAAWYLHGIYTLFLAPVGLGVLYYLIPKCAGLSAALFGPRPARVLDLDRRGALDRGA